MAGRKRSKTTRAYFRRIYQENPTWLWERSNDQVFDKWMADHGKTEVPDKIKVSLAAIKGSLRAMGRDGDAPVATATKTRPAKASAGGLDQLEIAIDACLQLARMQEDDDLEPIIKVLRQARNKVVMEGSH